MNQAELTAHLEGIHILPGQWRPLFPQEHIAWVTPPWHSKEYPSPNKEYIWLDFPEAVFVEGHCHFLSHANNSVPCLFPDLPKVLWQLVDGGVAFQRDLPNGIAFGSRVTRAGESIARLELYIHNGTGQPLQDIGLQTCAFLRGATEFDAHTSANKLVHIPGEGWVSLDKAQQMPDGTGRWKIGFRGMGPVVADLPVIVAQSDQAERFVAMTWGEHTASLIGNPRHPCIHADPVFKDLEPGEEAIVQGALYFGQGPYSDISEEMIERWLR